MARTCTASVSLSFVDALFKANALCNGAFFRLRIRRTYMFIGCCRANKVDGTVENNRLWVRQLGGQGLHTRRWRVIVRNVNFRANERAIAKVFHRSAGFPWEVTLPRNDAGKPRGFAFVGFICREHAQNAIDNVNNTKVITCLPSPSSSCIMMILGCNVLFLI